VSSMVLAEADSAMHVLPIDLFQARARGGHGRGIDP
jgi:hypothetical protein